MPNSPDALLGENEAEPPTGNPANETNAAYQARTSTTVLELRRLYGLHFAPGYGDDDTLGHLLANSGLNTLDEYLERHTPERHIPERHASGSSTPEKP
ncbi:MAG TPA: hypothetical protein VHW70_08580 [Edaphobacter sp.]|nr:hypothetical protein [Edaphobacter sp.]